MSAPDTNPSVPIKAYCTSNLLYDLQTLGQKPLALIPFITQSPSLKLFRRVVHSEGGATVGQLALYKRCANVLRR